MGIGAACLLPVVTSILVPTPAEAAATCIQAESCPGNTEQPCYNTNPGAECPTFKCIGAQVLRLIARLTVYQGAIRLP